MSRRLEQQGGCTHVCVSASQDGQPGGGGKNRGELSGVVWVDGLGGGGLTMEGNAN